MYVYNIFYASGLESLSIIQEIISSQERHQNMKWFDAGTKVALNLVHSLH